MQPAQLRNRAIRTAREFFAHEQILEVRTPRAVVSAALEPYIDTLSIAGRELQEPLQLATSPEFSLKKIFRAELQENPTARGIYEIAPVFRDDAASKNHSPEFTLVEWYTRETTLDTLLDTTARLITTLATATGFADAVHPSKKFDLPTLFRDAGCAFDFADERSVVAAYQSRHPTLPTHLNTMDAAIICFNLLFDEFVLPILRAETSLVALVGYPTYLAALAYESEHCAERAEIYYRGLELANGYREEYRAEIARARWLRYNAIRALRGVPEHKLDEELLAHLADLQGVCGIAVGLERVLACFNEHYSTRDLARID
ncbi:MAG: hypothetical protein JSR44_01395 [Spirochaetes bacterium]|nr:hypothetical protein [Spirochaetota bacterium]